jgi:dihydropteroate synthase
MGIVNVTPNSFYDGGRYEAPEAGRERVVRLLTDGADVLDIGAESSKPGAPAVPPEVQLERIASALDAALAAGAIVSIDTASAAVAEPALARGAHIINDVTCLSDPELASAVARRDAYLLLSHARAHQSRMAGFSDWPDDAYTDVVAEVRAELEAARELAVGRGVRPDRIWFDPGLGFSKNARHSLELLRRLSELSRDGTVIVAGTGRKSFISAIDESTPADRLGGTVVSSLWASRAGAALLRVHDVQVVRQALRVDAALRAEPDPAAPRGTAAVSGARAAPTPPGAP